ncbi:unnamed protein product [Phytophthora fragariaefolia]|uniref:Unnamed protein product n=1 Tax=Phytophthora fragariaefolia TaxID=1490495 RepID=A0A9W6YA98_9STRA|nr:unnamed protein product [Phytophthora fragariaefolia]
MALESPATLASELNSLPAISWKRFARDLHDGCVEQICILSDVERMESEAEELKQLVTEGTDALCAKSKKERFDEQSWDPLKSIPLYDDLQQIRHMYLYLAGFRCIVNCIWIQRVRYRMVLGGAIPFAPRIDTFISQAAREVLRLSYSLPLYVYYDRENGLGLGSCEQDANGYRFQLLLRILNSSHLPVHHLMVEQIEYYQPWAGLTENPFENPIRPPPRVQSWVAQTIRYAAGLDPPIHCNITRHPFLSQHERMIDP